MLTQSISPKENNYVFTLSNISLHEFSFNRVKVSKDLVMVMVLFKDPTHQNGLSSMVPSPIHGI